jgi:hypothetical protein
MEQEQPVLLASYKAHGSTLKVNLLDNYHINLFKTFGFYIVHKNTCIKVGYNEIKEISAAVFDDKSGIIVTYKDEVLLNYSVLTVTDILIPGRDQKFFGMINDEMATLENSFINIKCRSVLHVDRKAKEKNIG